MKRNGTTPIRAMEPMVPFVQPLLDMRPTFAKMVNEAKFYEGDHVIMGWQQGHISNRPEFPWAYIRGLVKTEGVEHKNLQEAYEALAGIDLALIAFPHESTVLRPNHLVELGGILSGHRFISKWETQADIEVVDAILVDPSGNWMSIMEGQAYHRCAECLKLIESHFPVAWQADSHRPDCSIADAQHEEAKRADVEAEKAVAA